MQAVVTKDNFKKILGLVSHVVGNAASLPILSNILLETEKGRLKISATNLEIGLTCWLGGKVEKEGKVTLPAKTINDYVSTTLGDQVSLKTSDGALSISTDASSANVKTLPSDEFPLIPKLKPSGSIKLSAEELKDALNEAVFATAPQETQPELSGVYVYVDENKVFFVATDRYRLVERTISTKNIKLNGEFKPVVVPQRTIQEVLRLISSLTESNTEVAVTQGENQIKFELPDIELVSRLVDGEFPDYKQIIPDVFNSQAVLPRHEFLQAVKSAGLFTATGRSIKLAFNPKESLLKVSAASADFGESETKIPSEVEGDELETTFNYRYIVDYLNNISDEKVIFKAINDTSPAVINPEGREDSLYLVMPVKS